MDRFEAIETRDGRGIVHDTKTGANLAFDTAEKAVNYTAWINKVAEQREPLLPLED